MMNFTDWLSENPSDLPWLIIGKGPTFEKIKSIHLEEYQTIALNHTVTEVQCDIFHLIDLDVLEGIETEIANHANYILLPYFPHVDNLSGTQSLNDLVVSHPFLSKMDAEGRLLWYNSSLAHRHHPDYPIVPVCFFSADAVVSLLATHGVKTIWSAGIDGGNAYNSHFSYLNNKSLLSNQRESFDAQFVAIANSLEKHNAKLIPLHEDTIRVFVGTQSEQWLCTNVLAFSIKLRTSASVDVYPLHHSTIKYQLPKAKKNQPRTPFSFQRFLIPELSGFTGRAIYVDSDMQVFTDIRDLACRDMGGQDILNVWEVSDDSRRPQFSVMLMNCEALKWKISDIIKMLDAEEITYEELLYEMKVANNVGAELEQEWNSLEHFEEGKTKLIHYTDMNQQPWLYRHNPYASIWVEELARAIEYGYLTRNDVKQEILKGNVRPTLYYQLKSRVFDSRKIPKKVVWVDKFFKPPHRQKKFFWRNPASKVIRGQLSLLLIRLYS